MRWMIIVFFVLALLIAGCAPPEAVEDKPVVPDAEEEPIDYEAASARAGSMMMNLSDLGEGWKLTSSKPTDLSRFRSEYARTEAKSRGFKAGWKKIFDTPGMRVSQEVFIFHELGADERFADAVDDVASEGYDILDLDTVGEQSLAYILRQDNPLEKNDYYRLKFTKGDVYEFIYVKVKPGVDASSNVLEFAKIAESKVN